MLFGLFKGRGDRGDDQSKESRQNQPTEDSKLNDKDPIIDPASLADLGDFRPGGLTRVTRGELEEMARRLTEDEGAS